MWSLCLYTTARVPSSISKSFRSQRGITTWPFVVNDTVSVRCVELIIRYPTYQAKVSQQIFCWNLWRQLTRPGRQATSQRDCRSCAVTARLMEDVDLPSPVRNYGSKVRCLSSRAFSSFLYSAHHWRNGFSPGFLLRIPRAREMAAAVIGFSKIPSGVDSTTAFVPFSISNSLRMRRGITTWPFVVNETVSARSVELTTINPTFVS